MQHKIDFMKSFDDARFENFYQVLLVAGAKVAKLIIDLGRSPVGTIPEPIK